MMERETLMTLQLYVNGLQSSQIIKKGEKITADLYNVEPGWGVKFWNTYDPWTLINTAIADSSGHASTVITFNENIKLMGISDYDGVHSNVVSIKSEENIIIIIIIILIIGLYFLGRE